MTRLKWHSQVDSVITGMPGRSIAVVCKMCCMVSKPKETFNYYSASHQNLRKSAFGHQKDEINVKITTRLVGL